MAEFCLDCWNELNGTDYDESEYIISEELDLCEGCGEYKHVIIEKRQEFYMFEYIISIIFKLLTMPYLIYKKIKSKKQNM